MLHLVRISITIEFHFLLMEITHLKADCKVALASFTFEQIQKNIIEAVTQNCSSKQENWKKIFAEKGYFSLSDIVPHLH